MWDPYAEFEKAVLPNGLTVYAAHWPNRPWEHFGFIVHSGSREDPIGYEGTAHFVEHLVSENSIMSTKQLHSLIEPVGGTVNLGATSFFATTYTLSMPIKSSRIIKAINYFAHSLYSEQLINGIEKERQIILSEIDNRFSYEYEIELMRRKRKMVHHGLWIERFPTSIGDHGSNERIDQPTLQKYYDANYTPANISIICVGGLCLEEVCDLIQKSHFGIHKAGKRTPRRKPISHVPKPKENLFFHRLPCEDAASSGGYESLSILPGTFNRNAIRLFCGMLNRVVFHKLRVRNAWTYDVSSEYGDYQQFYEIAILCNAFVPDATAKIDKAITHCIADVAKQKRLFSKIKRAWLADPYMADLSGFLLCKNAMNMVIENYRLVLLPEYFDQVNSLDMNDICEIVEWLKPERRWTLIRKP